MKRSKHIPLALIAAGAIWFLGIDWSWFVHDCPDCGHGKDIAQYRIFSMPIHETTHHYSTVIEHVAGDLGVPCSHANATSWQKHRWWGLLYCKAPCINGLYRLKSDDSWYDREASEKVAALANRNDSIRREFVQNVFEKHDFKFVRTVLTRAGIESESQ